MCGKEYGELGSEHSGEVDWMKHLGVHYLAYSCCAERVSEPVEHTMVDGACTECGFNPSVNVTSVEVASGETQVVIALSVTDNPGITGLMATVQYSENVFTLTGAESGEALGALDFTAPGTRRSGCTFLWDAMEINDGDIKDGEFLILTFSVSSRAPEGEYSILVKIRAYDNDLTPFNLIISGGKVTVKK